MRSTFLLVLGLLLIGMGAFVAIRPVVGDGSPLTGSRWLDLAFAVVFLVRGVMNVRAGRTPARPAIPPRGPGAM